MPPSGPDRQAEGGMLEALEGEKNKESKELIEREREKNGGLTERIEPFSRPTGVGSVLTVIELNHQLAMRLLRPGGQLGPRGAPSDHRSTSCCLFWLFPSLIGLIGD